MKITFPENAWAGYLYWQTQNKKFLKQLNGLIDEVARTPVAGTGKPEALKHELAGCPSVSRMNIDWFIGSKMVDCRLHSADFIIEINRKGNVPVFEKGRCPRFLSLLKEIEKGSVRTKREASPFFPVFSCTSTQSRARAPQRRPFVSDVRVVVMGCPLLLKEVRSRHIPCRATSFQACGAL